MTWLEDLRLTNIYSLYGKPGNRDVHLHQLWHFLDDSEGTESRLLPDVSVAGLEEFLNVWSQVPGHVRTGDTAQRTQSQPSDELVGAAEVVLQTVRDQLVNLLVLVQQQHGSQVSDPLVGELGAGYQLGALQLTEVSRVAQHVNVEQLGHVPAPPHRVLLAKGVPDVCTFLEYQDQDTYGPPCQSPC